MHVIDGKCRSHADDRAAEDQEAMFYVESSRPPATFCEDDNLTWAPPEG